MKIYKKVSDNYYFLSGIISFIIYFLTTSRSIGEIDSGELAAVQATWGIAHPTGYPMFSLLGYLYSKLPIAEPLIFQLNLFQAILNSLTVIILNLTIHKILENLYLFVDEKKFSYLHTLRLNDNIVKSVSFLSALVFAFSITFWKQATRVEVYSLQIFLTSIIIYYLLRVVISSSENKVVENKNWYLIAILIGLAFSNHLMTLYLLPATIYTFFVVNKPSKRSYILFTQLMLISFSIAFFFYLLMMFRAQSNPEYTFMNEPRSFGALIDYVRGKYYESKMFQGIESVKKQSYQFLNILSFSNESGFTGGEFGFFIIPVFSGMVFILIFLKRLRIFYSLLIITSLFFVLNYSIPDIDEYFLVIFLLFTIASAIVTGILTQLIWKVKLVLLVFLYALLFWQVKSNYPEIDRSNDYVIEDYATEVLNLLPSNAIVLTSDWPLFAAPSYFLQYALNIRKDVEVLGVEMLPLPSYKLELKQKYKTVENLLKNDYFVTMDVFKDYIRKGKFNLAGKTLIPEGLCFRVSSDTSYSKFAPVPKRMRFLNKRTIFHDYLYHLTGFMLETRARYELQYDKVSNAQKFLSIIKKDYPDYNISHELIKYVE
jgi:hypothetical protein